MSDTAGLIGTAIAAWIRDTDLSQVESGLTLAIEILEEWPSLEDLLGSEDPPTADQVNEARCLLSEIRHILEERAWSPS